MKADTIYALASGASRAGVAVVRISGPESKAAFATLSDAQLEPRRAVRTVVKDKESGDKLDDGLAILFPAPASFTGEDVVELHIHGGRAVIAGVLEALGRLQGLRLAEPGEFTRRAFESGKMDLTAAEGLADLVAAETEAQRRQALRQSRGELGNLYESWRQRLTEALAHFEASIDFSDEELPSTLAEEVEIELTSLTDEIDGHLTDERRGERLRDGFHLAIIGPPNVGKSTLLNVLAQRDAAIVAATAGTTRDVVEVNLDLAGYPVVIADTAGLRKSNDAVEEEGIRRAHCRARDADMRLAVFDAEIWPDLDDNTLALIDDDTIIVVNKIDLAELGEKLTVAEYDAIPISALTGAGIERLLATLANRVARSFGDMATPAPTRVRHRQALENCCNALTRAKQTAAEHRQVPELMAEDMRLAIRALGRITGRVDVEDLLDIIFRDFCIGK